MSYLSFHAGTEGKTTRKNIKGMTGHSLRKTENRYGSHKNEMIDRDKTKYNIDWTKEGLPLEEIVDERLESEYRGKRALRKDAVVIREVIVQASTDVYEGMSLEQKREKTLDFTKDSFDWFKDEFGEDNVIGYSAHLDETNPHVHFMVMPMTQDGRMSQKDFFKGPSDLKRQHREFRESLNSKGWSFEMENKYKNVDGISLPKYKANAKEIEEMRQSQDKELNELLDNPDIRNEALKSVKDELHAKIFKGEKEKLDRRKKIQDSNNDYLKKKEVILKDREERLQLKEKQVDVNIAKSEEVLHKATLEGKEIISKAELEAKEIRTGAEELSRRTKRVTQQGEELSNKRRLPKGFDF